MNNLTIIPIDKVIYVDGFPLFGFDMSGVPVDVHALQWANNSGTIERKGSADEIIDALPQWATDCYSMWITLKTQLDNPPPPTDEEKSAANKMQAMNLINSCDWTQLSDVNLTNKSDWATYRAALRVIINNPTPNDVFPTKPIEIWGQ
jgi:hypothetical protein